MEPVQTNRDDDSKDGSTDRVETVEILSGLERTASVIDPVVSHFPEGGLWGWLAVAGTFAVQMTTSSLTYGAGVFISYYSTHQLKGYTISQISWVLSAAPCLHSVIGVPVGKLYDDGYVYYLMGTGAILYVSSFMFISVCNEYYQFMLAQGILVGLATGLIFQPPYGIIAQYFQKRRALAMGLASSGSALGGVIWPILFNNLFARIGFGWGMRIVGFINLVILCFALAVLRTRLPPARIGTNRPARTQATEDGIDLTRTPSTTFKDYKVFFNLAYTIPVLGCGLLMSSITYLNGYIQVYAETHNVVSPTLSFYILSILMAGAFFGAPFFSLLADYFGVLNVNIGAALFCAAFQFSLLGANSPGAVVVIAFVYGFFANAFQGTLAAIFARLSFSVAEMGQRMGFGFFVLGIGALIGSPIQGALLGEPYVWWRPSIYVACAIVTGVVALLFGRVMIAKRLHTRYV